MKAHEENPVEKSPVTETNRNENDIISQEANATNKNDSNKGDRAADIEKPDKSSIQTVADAALPESGQVINRFKTEAEYRNAIKSMDQELNQLFKVAETTFDWKEIRQRLTDLREKLIALFLKDEDNDKIRERIDQTLALVDKRQSEEREKFDSESGENYDNVKDKVSALIEEVKESKDFKTARESLVKAQDLFRGLRLKKSHRDELFNKVSIAFDELNKRQVQQRENFEMETIENYHKLKKIIEEAVEFSKQATNFGKARERLIQAQSKIKGKKLKRDQREDFYRIIREHFEMLNLRQSEDREHFDEETSVNYNNLRKIVDDAIAFAKSSTDFKQSREELINAQATIKQLTLKRSQRDELYGDIRKVFTELNKMQSVDKVEFEKEAKQNYERLTREINDAFEQVYGLTNFRMIRETLITIQGEIKIMKLNKGQRKELFSRLREAFSVFDKKKQEYFDEKRKENIERFKAKLNHLNKMKEQLTKSIESIKKELDTTKQLAESSDSGEHDAKLKKLNKSLSDAEKSLKANQRKITKLEKEIMRDATKMEKKENKIIVKDIIDVSTSVTPDKPDSGLQSPADEIV